ncbi:MAG: formylglycine-generating enzyme family protein [Pseudonocardiaceae bacterium]
MSTRRVPPDTSLNPNLLDDRSAMGLPKHLVTRLPEDIFGKNRDLLDRDVNVLVAVVESAGESFARRFVAASLLGLIGDPRIRPQDPVMVDVPAARVRIGLARQRVAEVVRTWWHVGVVSTWIEKECPEHHARVAAFRIARYPVTNAEYRRFLADTGAPWPPSSWTFGSYPHHLANHPVWTVPPEAADAYAAWLATVTGRGFRLPTEAEWEYAASGGDGREHPWGQEFDCNATNTVESGPLTTTPVGIYPTGRSPFGVDDMGGNVEEYVADTYHPYPGGEPIADDLQQQRGEYRIARGGSFTRYGDLTRCRRRHGWYDKPIYAMGFRLSETP